MRMLVIALVAMICGSAAQAADIQKKRVVYVQPPPQQQEPLRQIPIVGTVVYGGLNYAGALIMSPFELLGYRR